MWDRTLLRRIVRLFRAGSSPEEFLHEAPDLEATMPTTVGGQALATWSVSGDGFWSIIGEGRARSSFARELEAVGIAAGDIELAVAGRADATGLPSIVSAFRFGHEPAIDLPNPAIHLAMAAAGIDASKGSDWVDSMIAGRPVRVGNREMVHQDVHHRGLPYVYLTGRTVYTVIADSIAWAEDAIGRLPVFDEQEPRQSAIPREVRYFLPSELASAIRSFIRDLHLAPDRQLSIDPVRRMFSVRLKPSPADGAALVVQIPVGTDARRAALISGGWVKERTPSGTPYYTKRIIAPDGVPEQVVDVIVEAYQLVYGDRANGLRWRVEVQGVHVETVDSVRRPMAWEAGRAEYERIVMVAAEAPDMRPLRDRMIARFREHRARAFLMAALGLGISALFAAGSDGVTVPPLAGATILVGGTAGPMLSYLTGVPSLLGRRAAETFGFPALRGILVFSGEASLSLCVTLGWGLLLVVLFGVRLDR